jgi:hypothetical protein
MLPSSKFSESNYGYPLEAINGNDSSHYYSGVIHPGAYFPTSKEASVYKPYSNAHYTEPLSSSQTPLTIIDAPNEPLVRSYLSWSIFNLICCGLIWGIIASVFSLKVISLKDRRAFKEAQRLSDKVLFGNLIVTMVGVFLWILIFPYVFTAAYPYLPKINY